jgi:hypothetical protein
MRQAIAVVLVLAACGTDSLSIDDYPDAVRDSFCSYLVKCGEVEDHASCASSYCDGVELVCAPEPICI